MTRLVRAELTKIWSTRSTWVLAALAALFCALWTVVSVLTPTYDALPADARLENIYQNAQQGYLFGLILGVLGMTSEYRHQTITWSFLATPRRQLVVLAKLLSYGLILGLALAALTTAATVGTAVLTLAATGEPVFGSGIWLVLLGSASSTVLYPVLGVALGALVRNQVAAVSVAFGWFYYAEFLLVWFLPDVGRWVPSGAAKALSGWHLEQSTLLPPWAGGLVFLTYAAILAAIAYAVTLRRDIT